MNCVTFCNMCSPTYHGVNSIREMREHLEKEHNLKIKSDYDLLDYFTKWSDEDEVFNYIGVVVRVPNGKRIVLMQNCTVHDAKQQALRSVILESNRNRNAKVTIVRKQTSPISKEDMGLTRTEFSKRKTDRDIAKGHKSHTQKLSENEGVKTC